MSNLIVRLATGLSASSLRGLALFVELVSVHTGGALALDTPHAAAYGHLLWVRWGHSVGSVLDDLRAMLVAEPELALFFELDAILPSITSPSIAPDTALETHLTPAALWSFSRFGALVSAQHHETGRYELTTPHGGDAPGSFAYLLAQKRGASDPGAEATAIRAVLAAAFVPWNDAYVTALPDPVPLF